MNSQMKRYVGQGMGVEGGASMPSLGEPLPQHLDVFTNLDTV